MAALIHRMLSKSPSARPQDYDDLMRQLDRTETAISTPIPLVVSEPSRAESLDPRAQRPAGRLAAYCVLGVLAIAAVGILLKPDDASPPATQPKVAAAAPLLERSVEDPTPGPLVPHALPRVRGASGARPDLSIQESSHEWTPEGMLRIFGRVENSGNAAAEAVIVRIVLATADGQTVDSLEVPALPTRLEAGEKGDFEAFFANPRRKVSILVELHWLT
jgi:hypothetical protein